MASENQLFDVQSQLDLQIKTKKRRVVIGVVCLAATLLIAIWIVVALVISSDKNHKDKSTITITTSLGKIMGNRIDVDPIYYPIDSNPGMGTSDIRTEIYEFVGIRYGFPPINEKRFQPSTSTNDSFIFDGMYDSDDIDINSNTHIYKQKTYNATSYRKECVQGYKHGKLIGNEDCLFLNIWTPAATVHGHDDDDDIRLPVMVFIYGGGFTNGAGSDYNGTYFIRQGNNSVIFVSINYRVGIFGFLQSKLLYEEGISGAYGFDWPSYGGCNGLYDQIVALRWIHHNIGDFGGDNRQITLFGESAGGQSVCSLNVSPLVYNSNLFYQSIIESGPCFGPWKFYDFDLGLKLNDKVLQNATKYQEKAYNLTFLRNLTAEQIYLYVQLGNESVLNFSTFLPWDQWWPSIDLWVLPNDTDTLYTEAVNDVSKFASKRVIWGSNSADTITQYSYNNPFLRRVNDTCNYTLKDWLDDISSSSFNISHAIIDRIVNEIYPLSEHGNSSFYAWLALTADVCVTCPLLNITNQFLNASSESLIEQYSYYFEGINQPWFAGHGSELIFLLFWAPPENATRNFHMKFNKTLSQQMINAWQSFGTSIEENIIYDDNISLIYDNNISFYNPRDHDIIEWFQYNTEYNQSVFQFNRNIKNEENFRNKYHRNGACQFWSHFGFEFRFNLCSNRPYYV